MRVLLPPLQENNLQSPELKSRISYYAGIKQSNWFLVGGLLFPDCFGKRYVNRTWLNLELTAFYYLRSNIIRSTTSSLIALKLIAGGLRQPEIAWVALKSALESRLRRELHSHRVERSRHVPRPSRHLPLRCYFGSPPLNKRLTTPRKLGGIRRAPPISAHKSGPSLAPEEMPRR